EHDFAAPGANPALPWEQPLRVPVRRQPGDTAGWNLREFLERLHDHAGNFVYRDLGALLPQPPGKDFVVRVAVDHAGQNPAPRLTFTAAQGGTIEDAKVLRPFREAVRVFR